MDGEDHQAMGRGSRLAGEVAFEHSSLQTNGEVLQIEGDGEERMETITESGYFKSGVAEGVARLISHVQTSKNSEGVSHSFESSDVTRNDPSYLCSGECSNSLRDDAPTGGVWNKDAIFQLSHRERLQLEKMENLEGNAETFNGEDVSCLAH